MPNQSVITFDSICFSLRLDELFAWNNFIIRLPIIRHNIATSKLSNLFPKFQTCFCSSIIDDKINVLSLVSTNTSPNPSVVFLCPTYV